MSVSYGPPPYLDSDSDDDGYDLVPCEGKYARASFSDQNSLKSKIPVASPTSGGVIIEDFRQWVIKGDLENVSKAIKQGVDVNIIFKTKWTPLMYASHHLNEPLITLLLSNKAHADLAGSMTPLMSCCTSNVMTREDDLEVCVNLLISHGADVNHTDKYSMTPLMMACKKGHPGAAKALIAAGADVNQRESRGYSALCWACTSGSLPCIEVLVDNGADISVRTAADQTPLLLAESTHDYSKVLAYFSQLPGYEMDRGDNSNLPSSNLANGTEKSPAPDITTEKHLENTVYTNFGEVEVFLYGLELSSLIPKFQSNDVTLEHLLNITDDELIKIGVLSVGNRKKILDSVHEMHKKDWQPSSIPAYEKVKARQQLSCAEVTAMIANGATHSACLSATLKYVTAQVARNPALLQVDQHGRGLHALRRFLHEMIENSQQQVLVATALRSRIEKTLGSGEAETVDHITRETTAKSGNRLVFYSSALITLTVLSFGVFLCAKKFPNLRIPGFPRFTR